MGLGSGKKPIPDLGSGSRAKKAPDPGSGSATLLLKKNSTLYAKNCHSAFINMVLGFGIRKNPGYRGQKVPDRGSFYFLDLLDP
jgi:hypothetical protein